MDPWLVLSLLLCLGLVWLFLAWQRSQRRWRDLSAQYDDMLDRYARLEGETLHLRTVRRDFVANISHELRTPLASIKLLVETLQEGALEDHHVATEFTRKIGQETDHLIGMTQELLDLARIEAAPSTHPTVFDPTLAVGEVVERMRALANGKRLRLTAEPSPPVPEVRADRDQVCRVLVNLLNNAIKFTPEGGQVSVSSYLEPDAVAISVSDTGPGIPAGEESRIFERFYKVDTARQRGGTGLGLSIARHIVEAQGGEIWVRNKPEGGACFTFTLPVDGAAPGHS